MGRIKTLYLGGRDGEGRNNGRERQREKRQRKSHVKMEGRKEELFVSSV